MEIHRRSSVKNEFTENIVDILEELDEDSREEESTSEMARELFVEDSRQVTDWEALKIYYEELADDVVVAIDEENEEVMGFTLVKENDDFFSQGAGEYFPHLAVTQSATRPKYQRQGVWSGLRDYVESNVVIDYTVEYLVSAVSEENEASQAANESRGMKKVAVLDYDDEEETRVYAKQMK